MQKPQYAILRFAKYKGPEIGRIEAHNERTKETYASNPDVDTSRSRLNFHLVEPQRKYRAEVEAQIAAAGCRTRKDSVRMVEALITASPEFFKGKKRAEIREFFQEALSFLEKHQPRETIISAVVHMDEKTPHMHLSFVPLTADKRLSAKDIVGNKKKLIWWQDSFWKHMVKRYPDLERGESASETGREYIPPRVFKQMTHLTKEKNKLAAMLSNVKLTNYRTQAAQIAAFLDRYLPDVEAMETELKKYRATLQSVKLENETLTSENTALSEKLKKAQEESVLKRLKGMQLQRDYEEAVSILDQIPEEVLAIYRQSMSHTHSRQSDCRR